MDGRIVNLELVTLETADGCLLDAAYWEPAPGLHARIDSCVFVHGSGGHAFNRMYRTIGEAFSAAGVAFLSINTRGHDAISRTNRRDGTNFVAGLAFEDWLDSPLDFHAGVDWLAARGYRRIALAGHSLGATKAIFVQAARPQSAVAAVIAMSPPRYAYAAQSIGEDGPAYLAQLAIAEAMVAEGGGGEVISVRLPIPGIFGAASYVARYGRPSPLDVATHLPAIEVPALVLYGESELETQPRITASGLVARAWAEAGGERTLVTIPGADHVYTGKLREAITALSTWLA